MLVLEGILLFLALLSFVAVGVGIPSRVNLLAVGLAFWVTSVLLRVLVAAA